MIQTILLIIQEKIDSISSTSESVLNQNDGKKTLSIIELITSGSTGGNIIMITLGLLSLISIYLLFERYSTIQKASKEDKNFLTSIKDFVENNDIQAAKTLCRNTCLLYTSPSPRD